MLHQNGRGLNMVVEKRNEQGLVKPEWAVMLVGLLCALFVQPTLAEELIAAEKLIIPPYAHSSLSSSDTVNDEDYLVPNSVPRRINNQLRIEKELRVDVSGLKETYRINDGHTTEQAFNHYLSSIKQLDENVLYQCSSRDCGRSSSWAQNIFNNSKLYGEDASQFYLSAAVQKAGQQWLVSVYTVERGNRRVYAHIETLKLNSPLSSDVALSSVTEKSPIFVFSYGLNGVVSVNPPLADINKIIELSQANAEANIYIVGHLQEGYSATQQALVRSKEAGEQVSSLLKKRGVDSARLTVIGVGPLVPYGQGAHLGNRVEVFVVNK